QLPLHFGQVVVHEEGQIGGNDFSDVGIVIEGAVVLQDLDNVALAVAMLFGLFYSLNMSYPSQLSYTFRLIQRVVMELDAAQLLRKVQNLKDKTATISHLIFPAERNPVVILFYKEA
uniref:Uncharacterized protein n=1 Tax=Haplochromis burtoni TaxID=8153 RepID=A0A3Q2VPP3_HAPBU